MWALVLTALMVTGGADGATSTPTSSSKAPKAKRFDPAQRQALMIKSLVKRGDPAAVKYVWAAVERGLPPASLEAFLDGAREKPNERYAPALRKLTRYRKDTIRARALVALASLGDDFGSEAALLALRDSVLDIRLLGLDLARVHTAPHVEEAVIRLLARDEELAAIVRAARAG